MDVREDATAAAAPSKAWTHRTGIETPGVAAIARRQVPLPTPSPPSCRGMLPILPALTAAPVRIEDACPGGCRAGTLAGAAAAG